MMSGGVPTQTGTSLPGEGGGWNFKGVTGRIACLVQICNHRLSILLAIKKLFSREEIQVLHLRGLHYHRYVEVTAEMGGKDRGKTHPCSLIYYLVWENIT